MRWFTKKSISQNVDVKNQLCIVTPIKGVICDVPQEKGTSKDINVKYQVYFAPDI